MYVMLNPVAEIGEHAVTEVLSDKPVALDPTISQNMTVHRRALAMAAGLLQIIPPLAKLSRIPM
jgi:hypothetical protein